jgi:hypothetical protein
MLVELSQDLLHCPQMHISVAFQVLTGRCELEPGATFGREAAIDQDMHYFSQ